VLWGQPYSLVTKVIALDLGGQRFRLGQREIKRRDRVFWHLFSTDTWAVSSKFQSSIRGKQDLAYKPRASLLVDRQVHHWASLIAIFLMIMKRMWVTTGKRSWAVSSASLLFYNDPYGLSQTSAGTTSLSSCYLRSWLPHSLRGHLHMRPSLTLTGS
jgi:hypothetical protein